MGLSNREELVQDVIEHPLGQRGCVAEERLYHFAGWRKRVLDGWIEGLIDGGLQNQRQLQFWRALD